MSLLGLAWASYGCELLYLNALSASWCCITDQRLLGHMDLDTREWFDGVLTAAARKVVKETSEVKGLMVMRRTI